MKKFEKPVRGVPLSPKHRKSTKSRDTINKTKAIKIVEDRTTQQFYASLNT